MRFYIIFGITLILLICILFYNPNGEYLGIYKENVKITYDYDDKDYFWIFEVSNNNIKVDEINNNTWNLSANNNGNFYINFYYTKDNKENYKYKIYYEFKVEKGIIYWIYGEANGLLDFPNPV